MTETYDALKIKGYRALSDEEIGMINNIKTHGDALEIQLQAVADAGGEWYWIAIAEQHFKQGIMALCRAVAKPEGF